MLPAVRSDRRARALLVAWPLLAIASSLAFAARAAAEVPSTVIDRDAVVAVARVRAPDVLRAQAEIARAEAELVGAGVLSHTNPLVQASGGPRVSAAGVSADLGINGWLPIPLLWDRWRALDAARAGVRAEERAVEVVQLSAVTMALDRFVRVVYAKAALALAEERYALAGELADATGARAAAGDAAQLDVELAEAERAASQAGVEGAQAHLEDATWTLALALGMPALTADQIRGDLASLRAAPSVDAGNREVLIDRIVDAHPRARAVRARRAQAQSKRERAALGWLPTIFVGAGYSYEEGAHIPNIGLRARLPVYDHGQSAHAEADAALGIAEREAQLLAQQLAIEVRRALTLRARAEAAATTLEAHALPHALNASRLAAVSYAAGKSDINAVLVIRRQTLALRAEHLARQLEAALAANRVGLLAGVLDDTTPPATASAPDKPSTHSALPSSERPPR